jgi:hypothetical protein
MKTIRAIILYLLIPAVVVAGADDAPVAKVGRRAISAAEFVERFELTPWNKEIRTLPIETAKKEFLYTLLAEKLWAQKAVELGFDTSAQVKANFTSLEKMFVRDALYRLEIIDKVNTANPNSSGLKKKALAAGSYQEFMKRFFADKTTEVNGKVYQAAASRILSLIQSKRRSLSPDDTAAVYLDAADFMHLKQRIGQDTLRTELLRYQERRSTLEDFIDYIHFDENSFATSDTRKLKGILSGKLRSFMEGEYLAWEGYKRDLENLPDVKNQLRIWKDNYLFMALRGAFKDSLTVTDAEAREYYEKRINVRHPAQVNIVEVLTEDLYIVEKILHESNNGADMHDLAARYSTRPMTKASRGEFGFFPVTSFGEIGSTAARAKIGDLVGPLHTEDGYSIFKVIGRKEEGTQDARPFDEVRGEIRKTILGLKNYHGLIKYTVKLAEEYGITVDTKVLNAIEVTNIFSVTYRYMGFGGRILGAPLISPYTEWVAPWKASTKGNL